MTPSEERYVADFEKSADGRKNALDRAWQTRNFEIELYWKRATYFWTMIGVLFAGYAVALSSPNDDAMAVVLGCVGVILSLAWYLVNRASSAWQRNWEAHIDALEDPITGPLYKTVFAPENAHSLFDWFGPLNMSPSKLTVAVSLFVTIIWGGLVVYALPASWNRLSVLQNIDVRLAVLGFTAFACFALLRWCRTGGGNYKLGFRQREAKW